MRRDEETRSLEARPGLLSQQTLNIERQEIVGRAELGGGRSSRLRQRYCIIHSKDPAASSRYFANVCTRCSHSDVFAVKERRTQQCMYDEVHDADILEALRAGYLAL